MRMGHRRTHSHTNSHTAVGYRRVQELAVSNPGRRNNRQLAVRSLRLTFRVRVPKQKEQERAYRKIAAQFEETSSEGSHDFSKLG
jgi:hypothetical protein